MAIKLDKESISKIDNENMIKHYESFPQLCEDAFLIGKKMTIPSYFIKAKKIVMVGMGGSGVAGDIIKEYLLKNTNLFVDSIHNYDLPNYVDSDTLVIANSNSGNTEETLSAFISAHEKGAKLIAITRGGKLELLAKKFKAPVFTFDYDCKPRASFPYLFVLLLSVFIKLGHIKISDSEIDSLLELLEQKAKAFGADAPMSNNIAKQLAQKLYGKVPVIYATERLSAVASRWKAQFNENSKTFSYFEELPELNHKSLEGIVFPKDAPFFVIMLESNNEQDRNILRQSITTKVLNKAKVPLESVRFLQAKEWLSEIMTMVSFGDFVSFYLAILNQTNPNKNDTVDFVKEKLM